MSWPPQQAACYPPQPPAKRSKARLWVTLGALVVVLGGLAFTGFVTPGFFLSKADTTSRGTPQQLGQSLAKAIGEGDSYGGLLCKTRSRRSYGMETALRVADGDQVTVTPPRQRNAIEFSATLSSPKLHTLGIAMVQGQGGWCVRDLKPGGEPEPLATTSEKPGPRPQVATGEEAIRTFLAAVNARNLPDALALICSDAPDTTAIGTKQLINDEPKFDVSDLDHLDSAGRTMAELTGTIDGNNVEGRAEAADNASTGPCVSIFSPDSR
jgi:hypothetical protein